MKRMIYTQLALIVLLLSVSFPSMAMNHKVLIQQLKESKTLADKKSVVSKYHEYIKKQTQRSKNTKLKENEQLYYIAMARNLGMLNINEFKTEQCDDLYLQIKFNYMTPTAEKGQPKSIEELEITEILDTLCKN